MSVQSGTLRSTGYDMLAELGLTDHTPARPMSADLYRYVLARLREKTIPQKEVARASGVPFSTVAKIAQGQVTEPSVHTVQRLYDYFRSKRG